MCKPDRGNNKPKEYRTIDDSLAAIFGGGGQFVDGQEIFDGPNTMVTLIVRLKLAMLMTDDVVVEDEYIELVAHGFSKASYPDRRTPVVGITLATRRAMSNMADMVEDTRSAESRLLRLQDSLEDIYEAIVDLCRERKPESDGGPEPASDGPTDSLPVGNKEED